ncbi:MAG: hypothetical protein COX62_02335 [Deltaproteobacteria bacterium CG_4_10_14_0_2_um_filter_43_8]|nr:MAG: hypothetical protein COV43_07685 [Deltaproteobacteria bacterium CG11_big_fil_rev_8_21_14_0_20_42_23]PJA21479.1 MAG: hypothetical protein COX62_02335 [Deltaproteobacteria bacterium CG_4_10_14_0_2_um_filter_43_8]PJC63344.1 MAG: hypothetical protein CO021_10050 [Deltaproteobacteria bacterium CG_4_9_14_0_2_um_filter_42_21]
MTGGAVFAVDKQILSNRIYVNLGSNFRNREVIANLNVDETFLFGAGIERPLVKKWNLDVVGEVYGSTIWKNFFDDEETTPVEMQAVVKKTFKNNLIATVGVTKGVTGGYTSSDFRFIGGVSYVFKPKEKEEPKPAPVVKEELIYSETVYHPFDEANYEERYESDIKRLAEQWRKHPNSKYRITSHTDSFCSDEYNQKLSVQRAEEAKNGLMRNGMDADSLIVRGMGESVPVAPNDTEEGRAKNRRTEFELLFIH